MFGIVNLVKGSFNSEHNIAYWSLLETYTLQHNFHIVTCIADVHLLTLLQKLISLLQIWGQSCLRREASHSSRMQWDTFRALQRNGNQAVDN